MNSPTLTPETAENYLTNGWNYWFEIYEKKAERVLRRCFENIKATNDYSFLKRLGYKSPYNEKLCINAFQKLMVELRLLHTFLLPICGFNYTFTKKNPLQFFFRPDVVIPGFPIITTEELFYILVSLPANQKEEALQQFAGDARSLSLLRAALLEQDCSQFCFIIEENQVDTTAIGQALAIYKQLPSIEEPDSFHNLDGLITATHRVFPELTFQWPILNQSSDTVFRGYLTKKNSADKFVYTREFFDPLFLSLSKAYFLTTSPTCLSLMAPQLKACYSVFRKDSEHDFLIDTLYRMGKESIMEIPQFDMEGNTPTEPRLCPLQKAPTFTTDDSSKTKKCLSLFDSIVNGEGHWLHPSDKDCFLYLLNLTRKRPHPLRRITWYGTKWQLKCLVEVLYPNRGKKEKPDYGDMALIFIDEDGVNFNLKDTPLQRHKRTVNDPIQADREEQLIRHFKGILGVD